MSSNSGENRDGGEQPFITDYVTYECSICGRTLDEEPACHPPQITAFERRLATGEWLLPYKREPDNAVQPVLGSDYVTFECLYATLGSLLDSEQLEEYVEKMPYQIPNLPWVANAYRQDLEVKLHKLFGGTLAAVRACEGRLERIRNRVLPSEVFAHLVYLDQFGLLPGRESFHGNRDLYEFCSDYYDVGVGTLRSEWLVERRVDRSKVFSTTEAFREDFQLELVGDVANSHPHAEYKPFDGSAVLDDHRDHNLVTRRAKQELLGLPYVDWTIAPHFFYLRSGDTSTQESASKAPPVVGFDFAGFDNTPEGQRLRYLGIVTEREEDPFEIYLQVEQLTETHANGLVILNNREAVYDFLHFLKTDERVSRTEALPDTRDAYYSIPNVRTLHETVVNQVELLDGIALMPRRKFLDEGFQTIDDLIPVPTYA